MKTPLILQHKELVFLLSQLTPKLRREILQGLKKHELDCLAEIFSNFLRRRLTDNSNIINKLRKFKKDIHTVALKRTPNFKKKAILLSKRGGSILSALLPLAVTAITTLLAK